MKNKLGMIFFLSLLSFGMCLPLSASQKRLEKIDTHKFRLFEAPGKNDPYSAMYSIQLDEIGMIEVKATVGGGKIKGNENPFRIWIVEANGVKNDTNQIEKKYIKSSSFFQRLGAANYAVDSSALNQTKGKYVIILSNVSKESHGVGTLTISYPAKENPETGSRQKRHKRE